MSDILSQLNDIEENVRSIKATWGNTIMTLDNIKSGLKADRQKATDEAYQRGLDDAWEAAKKIVISVDKGGLSGNDLLEIFGCESTNYAFRKYSASEVIEKLKAYEEQQKADSEIKVGDEVTAVCGNAVVVRKYTGKDGVERCEYWYYENARIDHDLTSNLRKTGRHFPQVAELLEAMKGKQQKVCATCKYIHNVLMCNTCYDFNKWKPKEGAE